MAKLDLSKYLRNNRITDQSLIDMANRDRIDPMDTYAAIFAANTGSNVDDSVLRAMSDYYTKNPIGEKTRANVEQYGVSEGDFLNRLGNLQKNYTVSVGPNLQARMNSYAKGMTPTSVQAKDEMPTSSVAPTAPMKIERVGQAGPVLSRKEAESIAKARGTDVESILSRSIKSGLTVGGNLATRFAKGKYDSPERRRELSMSGSPFGQAMGYGVGKPGTDSIRNFISTQGPIGKGSALYVDKRGGATSLLPRSFASTMPTTAPKPTNTATPGPSNLPGGGGVGGGGASTGAIAAGNNPQFNPALGGTPSPGPGSPAGGLNFNMPSPASMISRATGFRRSQTRGGKKAGISTTRAK